MTRSVLLCGACMAACYSAGFAAPAVRLNTVGFLPAQLKQATLTNDAARFTVVRCADGKEVFDGALSGALTNADTRERLFTADFSSLTNEGTYQLVVAGAERSAPFRIGDEVYREPFRTV